MKKIILFFAAFLFVVGFVNAEVTVEGDSSKNVTVGDVQTPVYAIDIGWSNMIFDWAYLSDTGSYGWKVHPVCDYANVLDESDFDYLSGTLFTDDECTTEATVYDDEATYYHMSDDFVTANVWMVDMSTGGTITPSLTYTPNSKYNFTTMSYTYTGMDNTEHEFAGGVLPSTSRICAKGDIDEQTGALICDAVDVKGYSITFTPGIDTTKTITTPTSGETIGTLTFTFTTN